MSGFLGPKPKKFYLGRPERGSIYENPTLKNPGPESYFVEPYKLNITGTSTDRLLMHQAAPFFLKKGGKDKDAVESPDEEADEPSASRNEGDHRYVRKSLPVASTLMLSKYRSAQGVIFDSNIERFHI